MSLSIIKGSLIPAMAEIGKYQCYWASCFDSLSSIK